MKYNKLVRDKIPEIIQEKGLDVTIHIATDSEYQEKLKEKLQEEVKEFSDGNDEEELADILEVIYTFCKLKGINNSKLERIRKEKAEKRGSFEKRIILDETKEK